MQASAEGANPSRYLAFANYIALYSLRLRGQRARALQEVENALARYPLDSLDPLDRPYLALAKTYALAGQPKRAGALLSEYERAVRPMVRRAAENPEYTHHGALGELALAEGRVEDAITEFQKDVSRGSCQACGLWALGRAYAMAGQVDSAIAVLQRYTGSLYLQRLADDAFELAEAYKRLGELHELRGERDKARQSYSRFVELWKDCDPELRPQVAEARRRLAALSSEPAT
jgi:tetratricopeptide (TPR) repeat protein